MSDRDAFRAEQRPVEYTLVGALRICLDRVREIGSRDPA